MTIDRGRDLGAHLFRFVIVADTHMNEAEDQSASPFQAMRLANPRTRWIYDRVREQAGAAFVVHLGDMINPVPALPTYGDAADLFLQIAAGLPQPHHLVPGNHDVGDKPVDWMPAASVSDEAIALYERTFGRQFYSFDAEGCHFTVVNTSLFNSGLAAEAEQDAFLESDLKAARAAGKRCFAFLHYPPFIASEDEAGSYDNIDRPGRDRLVELLSSNGVEAAFAGHVHNWFYNRIEGTQLYSLPSTTFIRQDYAELARVGPDEEWGRNARPKLGWAVCDVHERGHLLRIQRSYGQTRGPDEPVVPTPRAVQPFHALEPHVANVGMDLRHPWAEWVEIPATGALDEFARKHVRNDYPLYGLWEMGARALRVPLHDMMDAHTRPRMMELARLGHRFTVACYGVPDADARAVATSVGIAGWEISVLETEVADHAAALSSIQSSDGIPVFVSPLHEHHPPPADLPPGERPRFAHAISHGLDPADTGTALGVAASLGGPGLLFRAGPGARPAEAIARAAAIGSDADVAVAVHIRLAGVNLADARTDDHALANRVAETVAAGLAHPSIPIFFDAFVDVDRGYFVRHGFLDRRYDPRAQSRIYAHLSAALDAHAGAFDVGRPEEVDGGEVIRLTGNRLTARLVLPGDGGVAVPAPGDGECLVDLDSGVIHGADAMPARIDWPALILPGSSID